MRSGSLIQKTNAFCAWFHSLLQDVIQSHVGVQDKHNGENKNNTILPKMCRWFPNVWKLLDVEENRLKLSEQDS